MNLLYQKSGNDLATAPNLPIFFTPNSNQWRNDTVDLSALAGMGSVQLFIENRSDNGNALYLDNINIFDDTGVGLQELAINNNLVQVFPNPFNASLTVRSMDDKEIENIRILTITGQEVKSVQMNTNHVVMDVSDLSEGIYVVIIQTEDGLFTKKLMKP